MVGLNSGYNWSDLSDDLFAKVIQGAKSAKRYMLSTFLELKTHVPDPLFKILYNSSV